MRRPGLTFPALHSFSRMRASFDPHALAHAFYARTEGTSTLDFKIKKKTRISKVMDVSALSRARTKSSDTRHGEKLWARGTV